jgi:hypothetical protein
LDFPDIFVTIVALTVAGIVIAGLWHRIRHGATEPRRPGATQVPAE